MKIMTCAIFNINRYFRHLMKETLHKIMSGFIKKWILDFNQRN